MASNGGGGGTNVNIPSLIAQTQGTNNEQRNNATQSLQYLESNHFSNYIMELCRILGSPTETTPIRQGAGLLLKNCVGSSRSNDNIVTIRNRWIAQPANMRAKLKSAILTVLATPDRSARDTAVNVVSNLAMVETLGQWADLVPTLIKQCLSKQPVVMYSALKCIGQIAENENRADSEALSTFTAKILECIAHGMSVSHDEVQSEAIHCLYHIMDLIAANMQIEKERTIIFQMVCCGSSLSGNQPLRLRSFMSIGKLIECYYSTLKPYMQSIFQISKECIERGIDGKEAEDVTKMAIEVWSTTAEMESDIDFENAQNAAENQSVSAADKRVSFGFVNKALELLVPIFLKALLLQKEDYDEDEWTVRKAAACALELFAVVAGDNILKYVLQFVEKNIAQQNWRAREAAVTAFGSILDGPSEAKLGGLVQQILKIVLKLMSDANSQVRRSSAWTLGRICNLIPGSIDFNDEAVNRAMLEGLVKGLNGDNSMANKVCWCLASLATFSGSGQNNSHRSTTIYKGQNAHNLMRELLARANRRDIDGSLLIAVHEALNSIIHFSEGMETALVSLLPELVKQGLCVAKAISERGDELSQYKMAGLFSSMQVILDKLGQGCLSQELTTSIMQCCCSLLECESALVYEEALGCVTYVARCVGGHFGRFLEAANVQNMLIKAVRNGGSNEEICRVGVGCIGDVYLTCADQGVPASLQPFSDRVVSELLTLLISGEVNMELKQHIIDALTDILIAHGSAARRYSSDIMNKCLEIGCLQPPSDAEEDVLAVFNDIRCSICDVCRSCLSELKQGGDAFMKQFIPVINRFFSAVAQGLSRSQVNPTLLQKVIMTLSEAADYCDAGAKAELRTTHIQTILEAGGKHKEIAEAAQTAFQSLSGGGR